MSSFVRRASFVAAASLLCISVASSADQFAADEIIVTAARIEQPLSRVIGSTTVITRQEIERRQAHSVQELLRGETGLNVVNNGGMGKLSSVFVRGADAEQVLVLIDGVRAGSASAGTTPFEFLPIDQIERIEIVRGPRSSIYGADALGGVIQIFTRRADGLSFNLGAGSNDTYKGGASFGASTDQAWLSASASHLRSAGYNSCTGAPFPPGGGCFTYEPDDDAYDNTSGSLRAGYRLGERAEVEATAMLASGTTQFDGGFANESEFRERVLTLRGRVQPVDAWSLSLTLGQTRDDQDSFYDDPLASDARVEAGEFNTERRSASLQSDFTLTEARVLTLGFDYLDDRIDSTTPYDETTRDNIGVFGQFQSQFGAHNALLSARYDDNEQFGSHATANVGWKWSFAPRYSLTAAWGSSFGAPTFNDLYYPGFSNPDLEPEIGRSYELGLAGGAGALRWSATAFESRIDELIVYDARIFAPNNLNEARIRGLEVEAAASLGAWSIGLGYTGMDPRNRTPGPGYDNLLPRRARHSGHVEIGGAFGSLDARARLTAEGSRYDDIANTHRLGGYAILDLTLDYAISEEWSVQGKIGNALDREYRTVRFYEQDDRTFFASVRYQPR